MDREDNTRDEAAQHLRERCEVTHEAIKAGRTALRPYGVQQPVVPGDAALYLYLCPHCESTISRKRT